MTENIYSTLSLRPLYYLKYSLVVLWISLH